MYEQDKVIAPESAQRRPFTAFDNVYEDAFIVSDNMYKKDFCLRAMREDGLFR